MPEEDLEDIADQHDSHSNVGHRDTSKRGRKRKMVSTKFGKPQPKWKNELRYHLGKKKTKKGE